jgi:hypothetical protein
MGRRALLVVTALLEGATGLALLAVPVVPLWLLFAVKSPAPETCIVARIGGAALASIAVVCWLARNNPPGQTASLAGLLFYNVAAAGVLSSAGLILKLTGPLLWPGVALHTGLAIWCTLCLRAG